MASLAHGRAGFSLGWRGVVTDNSLPMVRFYWTWTFNGANIFSGWIPQEIWFLLRCEAGNSDVACV